MTSDLYFPLIQLDPRTLHHRSKGGGLCATQKEAFDDLPWKGHRQSDLHWNGLKGSPSIRPQLERFERVTVSQTSTGTAPIWNGLKGSPLIRPHMERYERVTVNTPTGTGWKGQRQSGIHLNCLKGSSSIRPPLGKRPRNRTNRAWAFLSGLIPSWYELHFGNILMPFLSWAQATPVLAQSASAVHYWSFGAKVPYCFPSVFINEWLQDSSQKFMLWRSTSRCLPRSFPSLFTLQSIQYIQLNAW